MVETENQANETSQATGTPDSLTLFAASIGTRFTKDEILNFMRLTSSGLFISEAFAGRFVDQYELWFQEFTKASSLRPSEKSWRRVFGSENPIAHYILDGRNCTVGFIVLGQTTNMQRIGVPLYRGSPLAATGYLHEKDPVLSNLQNAQVSCGSKGLEISFAINNNQSCTWNLKSLTGFRDLVANSRWLRKLAKGSPATLRSCVLLISRLMRSARHVSQRDIVLIPMELRLNKALRLIRAGTLMIIIDKEGRVERCYELVGRNLRDFLLSEIGISLKSKNTRRIRDARPIAKGSVVADLFTASQRYPLDVSALAEFIRLYRHVEPTVRFPARMFTTLDAIETFAQIYKNAMLRPGRNGSANFTRRENGNALFDLGRANKVIRFRVKQGRRPRKQH